MSALFTLDYNNIVSGLISQVDLLLNGFVAESYEKLADYLRIPLISLATLYVSFMGISMAFGWIQFSFGAFVKMTLKIGFIMTAALEWSVASEFFINLIQKFINEISDTLVIASPIKIPDADTLDEAMQIILSGFSKIGSVIFNSAGFSNFGAMLDGIIIWIIGYAIVGLALLEIILAKMMLAVLFTFTPLFVLCLFFRPFHGIFDRWLGLIFGAALLQIFVQSVTALGMSLAYLWVGEHLGSQALDIGNFGTLPIIIIGIVCLGMIHKAGQMGLIIGSGLIYLGDSGPASLLVGKTNSNSNSNDPKYQTQKHSSWPNSNNLKNSNSKLAPQFK